jgi:hypothetical protein
VALVGQRVGVRLAQQGSFPSVSFQKVSVEFRYTHDGINTFCVARVRNECWSPNDDGLESLEIARLLKLALKTFNLTGLPTRPNRIINQWSSPEAQSEPITYREIVDSYISFLEPL